MATLQPAGATRVILALACLLSIVSAIKATEEGNAQLMRKGCSVTSTQTTQRNVIAHENEVIGLRDQLRIPSLDRDAQFLRAATLSSRVELARAVRARLEKCRKQIVCELSLNHEVLARNEISEPGGPVPLRLMAGGVVTATSKSGLIEFDLGSDDGVREGQLFEIHNGATFLDRMRIRRTAQNRAVGERIPVGRGVIRKGDKVTYFGVTSRPVAPTDSPTDDSAKAFKRDPFSATKAKLHPGLRGLAENVAKNGTDGNFVLGKIVVRHGQVSVRVELAVVSPESLAMLNPSGFTVIYQDEPTASVVGTIDAAKLGDLAKLDVVVVVTPGF